MTASFLGHHNPYQVLGLRSPHDNMSLNIDPIGIRELPKVIALFEIKRHQAIKLLHHHGSDELIEAFLRSGVYTGGHRLPFTTRVDELLTRMTDSEEFIQ